MRAFSSARFFGVLLIVTGRIFGAATAVLLGLLAIAPPAWGVADPVAAGSITSLELNRGLYQLLKIEGVHLSKLTPGKVQGRAATFPAAGGLLDPTTGKGNVSLEGGIVFRSGKRRVTVEELTLDTTKRSLVGRIGGRRLLIATAIGVTDARNGFGVNIDIKGLKLRGSAAKVLNHKLGLGRVFRSGRSFAEAFSFAQPASVAVIGGSAALAGNEDTFAKLKSLDVEVGPFESATVLSANPPTFGFPLLPSGSPLPLDFSSGGVRSETGLRLIQQNGTLQLRELSLVGLSVSLESKIISADVAAQPPLADGSRFGVTPIATLDTAGASALTDPGTRTLTLTNVSVAIDQLLAEKLNDAFAKPKGKSPLFNAGEPLGTLSITAQAP